MQDRRQHLRQKTFLGARLEYANGHQTCDCLVRDMTQHGARLKLDALANLPQQIVLNLPQSKTRFNARIVWRGADTAGVEILERIVPAAPRPAAQTSVDFFF